MTQLAARLKMIRGDITTLAVDAIVNAANETLLGGGGVDGAIHHAAGPKLLEYCRKLGGCPTGEARITPGFNLPAGYVIHTVGPVWHGGKHGEAELLTSCYQAVFALAAAENLATLAFPAISCGVYGYPLLPACRIAITECVLALNRNDGLREVLLVAFNEEVAAAYVAATATLN